jgi:hypothetical protein
LKILAIDSKGILHFCQQCAIVPRVSQRLIAALLSALQNELESTFSGRD